MGKSLMVQPVRGWVRVDGVDCLRSLAIFYVLLNHVNMHSLFMSLHYLRNVPPAVANAVVWQGQAGVQIFFSVSGFLITATSIRRWGDLGQVNVREFYLLRLARLAPLMVTLLAILSILHGLHVPEFVVSQRVGGLKSALIAALTLRVGLLEATRGYLPGSWDVLWSLSVEEVFYLGFPLACRLPGRGKWLIAVLLAFVVMGPFGRTVLAHGNENWQEYSYLGEWTRLRLAA
jgi:peptidoglycan/LPS O-acetylase OafA/YrhL